MKVDEGRRMNVFEENCPAAVKNQINGILFSMQELLGNDLSAVYLYGSAVEGGFFIKTSDIDLIGVVDKRLNPYKRLEIAKTMLVWNNAPCPVEISLLAKAHLKEKPPKKCQFHFSPLWVSRYRRFLDKKEATHPILTDDFKDEDIPAHLFLTRRASMTLFGPKATDVFPEITESQFIRSIYADYRDFHWKPEDLNETAYHILTLCRLFAFQETGQIMSKEKAAAYTVNRLSKKNRLMVERALDHKYGRADVKKFPAGALTEFQKALVSKLDFLSGTDNK